MEESVKEGDMMVEQLARQGGGLLLVKVVSLEGEYFSGDAVVAGVWGVKNLAREGASEGQESSFIKHLWS